MEEKEEEAMKYSLTFLFVCLFKRKMHPETQACDICL